MIWTFNQTGSIPGVPGDFSGVRVEVDDTTNDVVSITPLAAHSEFEPAIEASADAPTAAIPATASEESQTEQSEPEHVAEAE